MSRIFIICLLFVADFTVAQSNFVAGSITKLNGETLAGEIDYREWVTTPQVIRFQPTDAPNEIQTYTPHELAAFKINYNQEEYHRAIVGINNEPIEGDEMTKFESKTEFNPVLKLDRDTVFLLVLVKGKINLFSLYDNKNKKHYFIQKGIDRIEELIYRVVLINAGGEINNSGILIMSVPNYQTVAFGDYKKQLIEVMDECPSIQQDIDRTLYSNDILKAVEKYNKCVGKLTYIKPKDKTNHAFYGYVGASQSFFSLKDSYNKNAIAFDSGIKNSFGIGFEWGIIRSINKLSINLEANYSNHTVQYTNDYMQSDGDITNIQYDITLKGWRLNALLKYVLHTGKWQPYMRGGIGRASYTHADYVRTETAIRRFTTRNLGGSELYLIGSVGLKHKSFFVETRYETGNDLNRTTGEDLKTRRLSVVAGYALSLNK